MCYVWSGIKQDLETLLLGKAKLQAKNLAVKVINVTLRLNEHRVRLPIIKITTKLEKIYKIRYIVCFDKC